MEDKAQPILIQTASEKIETIVDLKLPSRIAANPMLDVRVHIESLIDYRHGRYEIKWSITGDCIEYSEWGLMDNKFPYFLCVANAEADLGFLYAARQIAIESKQRIKAYKEITG